MRVFGAIIEKVTIRRSDRRTEIEYRGGEVLHPWRGSGGNSYYGRPLSVSGRPCYILPMFFIYLFIFFMAALFSGPD